MASNSGWDKTVPSGTSLINVGDDDIRSFKSSMEAWWEEEHYATDGSANSAGEHKLGAARAYVGDNSQLSNPVTGRVFLNTDDNAIWGALSTATWTRVASSVHLDSIQTWTEQQNFQGNSTTSRVITAIVDGDTNSRYFVRADGVLNWGSGSAGLDTNLYREGANHLKTDDKLEVNSLVVGGGATLTGFLSGTTTWDPAAIPADGQVNTVVDVTGAASGDVVIVDNPFLADDHDLLLEGYVSASDVVTLQLRNVQSDAASANPASRTVKVFVLKS